MTESKAFAVMIISYSSYVAYIRMIMEESIVTILIRIINSYENHVISLCLRCCKIYVVFFKFHVHD